MLSLAALVALAWMCLLWLGPAMPASAGAGSSGTTSMAMGPPSAWTIRLVVAFAMWSVMMIGMMTPSVAPMLLLYARVGRQSGEHAAPLAATGFFAGGYLLAWIGFSATAAIVQQALNRAALMTPSMALASAVLSGSALIAAGLYQWTPAKSVCLRYCQAPLLFLHRHGGFRRAPAAALTLGFRHGLTCLGCCWALMGLLFVVGIMNLLWIALISAFVLAEKLASRSLWLGRVAGLALIAGGSWLLASIGGP